MAGRLSLIRWSAIWASPLSLVWIAAAYLPGLGSFSVPLTGDQKVYVTTAMEMREAGSWLRPLLFGEPSYYKPPLQYWATLVGWEVFGFNLWGTLLPSVIAVLLTAYFLAGIARMLRVKRHLTHAGLWFAAALGTATFGTTAQMEIYLCLFFSAAWWAGLRYLHTPPDAPRESRRPLWLFVAFLIAGLAALIKSPLYSVFWVLGYATYLFLSGEWECFGRPRFWGALLLGIAGGAAWFAWILSVDGDRFVADYVIRENLAKQSGNHGTVGGLWLALAYHAFPLTLLAASAFRGIWRVRHRLGPAVRLLIAWCWAPALFFTLYPYRVTTYLYILVPAVALAVDIGWFRATRSRLFRWSVRATGALFAFGVLVIGVVAWRTQIVGAWFSIGCAVAAGFAIFCAWRELWRGWLVTLLAGVLIFRIAAVSLGEEDLAGLRAALADRQARSSDVQVAMLQEDRGIWHERGLLSVAIGRPIHRLETVAEASEFVRGGGLLILSEVQSEERLSSIMEPLEEGVSVRSWMRWRTRGRFPYRELILKGRSMEGFERAAKREFTLVYRNEG